MLDGAFLKSAFREYFTLEAQGFINPALMEGALNARPVLGAGTRLQPCP